MDNDRYYQLGSHDKLFNQIDELTDALASRDAEVAKLKSRIFKLARDEHEKRSMLEQERDQLRNEIAGLMVLLSRASITIGSFIEGNDWAQSDMDTMDSIDALIYRKALAETKRHDRS